MNEPYLGIPTGKPQLSVAEAVKLALGRLTDFSGRSRRSEFWWWMVIVMLVNYTSGFLTGGNLQVSAVVSAIIMLFGLAVTVRRLHDIGQSGVWVYISYALGLAFQAYVAFGPFREVMAEVAALGRKIQPQDLEDLMAEYSTIIYTYMGLTFAWAVSSIVVVVMGFIDSKPEPNKYGESPKYGAIQ